MHRKAHVLTVVWNSTTTNSHNNLVYQYKSTDTDTEDTTKDARTHSATKTVNKQKKMNQEQISREQNQIKEIQEKPRDVLSLLKDDTDERDEIEVTYCLFTRARGICLSMVLNSHWQCLGALQKLQDGQSKVSHTRIVVA